MTAGLVRLLTDFRTADPFVGIMKGVMLEIEPQVRVGDLTHAIPPQDVVAGALGAGRGTAVAVRVSRAA